MIDGYSKPLGVRVPQGQQAAADAEVPMATSGAPKTVVSFIPLQTYLFQYYDGKGEAKSGLVHRTGDKFFMHPMDEDWVKRLRATASWVEKAIKKIHPELFDSGVRLSMDVDVIPLAKDTKDG